MLSGKWMCHCSHAQVDLTAKTLLCTKTFDLLRNASVITQATILIPGSKHLTLSMLRLDLTTPSDILTCIRMQA